MNTEVEKLDQLSKVLLATSSINHMVAVIFRVKEEIRHASFNPNGTDEARHFLTKNWQEKEKEIESAIGKLKSVMEDLGNYMNGVDCIAPIDEKITQAAFDIITHGKDDTGL